MNPPNRRSFITLLGNTLVGYTLCGATLLVHGQGKSEQHGHGNDDHGDQNDHGDHADRGDDDQKDHGNHKDHGHGHENNGRGNEHGRDIPPPYFSSQDYSYLSRYYNGPRNLPPGLRKKYVRTGTLPPGWQSRVQPMPAIVIQQLPPIPPTYQRGYLDGYAVVVDPRSRIIVDAVDILNAVTRR